MLNLRAMACREGRAPASGSGAASGIAQELMVLQKPDKLPESRRANYLPALTSMRFLAALHVMLFHFFPMSALYGGVRATRGHPTVNLLLRGFIHLIGVGHVQVALFFILSGFILTYTYLDGRSPRRHGPRDFILARVARIYPVYLCAWAVMGTYIIVKVVLRRAQPISHARFVANGLTSLLCVHAWWPSTATAWNGPSWSISDEAFFYTLFALMFLGSATPMFRTSWRALWALFAATFLIKVGATVAYYALHLDGLSFTDLIPTMQGEHMEVLWWQTLLQYCPVFRLSEFVLGVILAKMFMARRDAVQDGGPPSMIASIPAVFVLGLYVAAAIASGVYLPHLAVGVVLIPVQALVIYRFAFPVASWTGLLSAPMVLLGEASYALYMFHDAVAKWVGAPLKLDAPSGMGVRSGQLLIHLVCAIVSVVLSVVIYKWIEVPSRCYVRDRLGKHLLKPRQPPELLSSPRGGIQGTDQAINMK